MAQARARQSTPWGAGVLATHELRVTIISYTLSPAPTMLALRCARSPAEPITASARRTKVSSAGAQEMAGNSATATAKCEHGTRGRGWSVEDASRMAMSFQSHFGVCIQEYSCGARVRRALLLDGDCGRASPHRLRMGSWHAGCLRCVCTRPRWSPSLCGMRTMKVMSFGSGHHGQLGQ